MNEHLILHRSLSVPSCVSGSISAVQKWILRSTSIAPQFTDDPDQHVCWYEHNNYNNYSDIMCCLSQYNVG